jgi:hypothetical protein
MRPKISVAFHDADGDRALRRTKPNVRVYCFEQ